MITLKLKSYNRLELEAMHSMLSQFLTTCKNSCNVGAGCKVCEYRRICDDCNRAMAFLEATLSPSNR